MKKKTSVLVLTGAITISNIGLTTSFADVNDETLLIQQISNKVHSQVSIEADGSARIAGQDGQLGTADDVFVRPGKNGQAPHVDQFGNVTVPTGGRVELPGGNIVWDTGNEQSIVVPAGTVITPNGNGGAPVVNADGSVKIPDGSMIVLPIGSDITLPSGSSVSGNGDAITAGGVSIKADGTAIVPGADGQIGTADDVFVSLGINSEVPEVDEFGNVTLPTGGIVKLPDGTEVEDIGDDHSIIVPGGTVITPNGNDGAIEVNTDGTVKVQEGSMVVLPNGNYTTPPKGSSVSSNGDVATASGVNIKSDGTIIVPGPDGQIGTADDVFVTPGTNGEVPEVDEFGNVKVQDGSKVVSSNGNTINVQNESVVSINGIVTQPDGSIIDSNGNNNQGGDVDNSGENVTNPDENNKPGEDINKPDEDVNKPSEDTNKPGENVTNPGENVTNPGENTNKPSESVTKPSVNVNNSGVSTENPNTGDRSVMGMLVLGSMALLTLVKNLKIKDKLFLK